jgi:hypothetical protein
VESGEFHGRNIGENFRFKALGEGVDSDFPITTMGGLTLIGCRYSV